MEEKSQKATVVLEDRKRLTIEKTSEVVSFSDSEVVLETALGLLQVTGTDLAMKKLDLESGVAVITGTVDSMYYPDDDAPAKKGFFARVFS